MNKKEFKQTPKVYNPLNLEIGERVLAQKISVVAYDEDTRLVFKEDYNQVCHVIGSQKKALGTYYKGSGYGEEYEPATLLVDKYVWFYLCIKDFGQKPFLVHPDDIRV